VVNGPAIGLVRFRLSATWRRRRGGYLTVAVLVGLLGGLALGSLAAARRTQSSYPVFLASTHPGNIEVITALNNPFFNGGIGYNAAIIARIRALPHVESVASGSGIDLEPLKRDGAPINISYLPISGGNAQGSVGGEAFSLDRLAVLAGRLPPQSSTDEFVTLPSAARAYGFHLGEMIRMGVYTNAETKSAKFGSPSLRPHRVVTMKLVGLVQPAQTLVADDIDQTTELGYFTPAFTQRYLSCCVNYTGTSVLVPTRYVVQTSAAISRLLPKGGGTLVNTDANAGSVAKAERALKPESIALGAFGGITGLAAVLILAQLIGRQLRLGTDESNVLRALGASPSVVVLDELAGTLGALAAGSLLAAGVAVALSPIAPLGPIRPVYPNPGVSFDWTVLGFGTGALFVVLAGVATLLTLRDAPHRVARRLALGPARPSVVPRLSGALGLRPAAATGMRFALDPGHGRNAVPVRSAILGSALAVVALLSTVIFGASLDTLVSTPRLYGWNWSYLLNSGGGDIPQGAATALLTRDPDVGHFTGAYFAGVSIDGQSVPAIGEPARGAIQPPILHGRPLDGQTQIVLGPITLAQLHKHIGQTVRVSAGGTGTTTLTIVGTATLPALGSSGSGAGGHLEMGIGAVVPARLVPAILRNPFDDPIPGPNAYFVDVKPGVNPVAARRSLEAIAPKLTNTANFGVVVSPVLHPAEIVNYRSLGTTPTILGSALGAGAVVALGLTLLASVRRRRRELALLKTLGFSRRQLATTVAWQATVAVAVGTAIGVPLGIVAGRLLWDGFAGEINAVPLAVVPTVWVVLIALGALVLANVISYLPGRLASATPTAVLLRAE
jgi:hypothetical protein